MSDLYMSQAANYSNRPFMRVSPVLFTPAYQTYDPVPAKD